MGFTYAGNLGGAGAPTKRNFLTNETMYYGQFCQSAFTGSTGGHVEPLDQPSEINAQAPYPIGAVTGIVDGSRTYVASSSGTAQYGDRTTYTVTQSDIIADGPSEVEVVLMIPGVTLFRAPIYTTVWGTALYEIVEASGDSGGTTITSPTATADIGDNLGVIYCRSGANRGIYRTITSIATVTTTVTVPFPYTIASGDVFVQACCIPGYGVLYTPATADCISGNWTGADGFAVYYHQVNLEESGKEFAIFTLWGGLMLAAA